MRIGMRARRKGAVVVVVLVCVMVMGAIGAVLLRIGLAQRAQVDAEARRLQSEWLAEAGFERATAQLVADHSYKGETWKVPSSALGGRYGAQVSIVVEEAQGAPGRRLVKIQADYPPEVPARSRHSKQAVIELGSGRSGETP